MKHEFCMGAQLLQWYTLRAKLSIKKVSKNYDMRGSDPSLMQNGFGLIF